MIDNKLIMSRNIKRLMDAKKVNATDVCETLGIKHNTFSDWVNGKSYPRIDKIEIMANYFGVSKSELVEEPIEIILGTEEPDGQIQKKALNFYMKYLSQSKKTRNIIDQLLESDD